MELDAQSMYVRLKINTDSFWPHDMPNHPGAYHNKKSDVNELGSRHSTYLGAYQLQEWMLARETMVHGNTYILYLQWLEQHQLLENIERQPVKNGAGSTFLEGEGVGGGRRRTTIF